MRFFFATAAAVLMCVWVKGKLSWEWDDVERGRCLGGVDEGEFSNHASFSHSFEKSIGLLPPEGRIEKRAKIKKKRLCRRF